MSRYRELLDESIVIKDLYKIRNVTDFAHSRPHLLREYPSLMSDIAYEYLRVNGLPKSEKQRGIARIVAALPKRRLLSDAVGAVRTMGLGG